MDCRERVLTTLDGEVPDKVPYYEHLIQQPDLAKMLGVGGDLNLDLKKYANFYEKHEKLIKYANKFLVRITKTPKLVKPLFKGLVKPYVDLVMKLKVDLSVFFVGVHTRYQFRPPNQLVNAFGQKLSLSLEKGVANTYYSGGAFETKEDYFENYPKQNFSEPFGVELFKSIQKCVSHDKTYMIPGIFTGYFDALWMGFGMEHFCRLLLKDLAFIKRVVREREVYYQETVKNLIDTCGVEAIMLGDDLAYNTGPFIAPKYYTNIIFPAYKRLVKTIHKRGVKAVFHSDGNIMPLVDGLIDCNFDSIHPWQVSANIDITEVKKKYGDKFAIMGNVPLAMLVHNSRKEIADYVKKLLRECAPGGGFFISSGNSITPDVPWQKYLTMLSTFWKYRDYPINIP